MAQELANWIIKKYQEYEALSLGSFSDYIPSKPGVYIISRDQQVMYVGSARDLDRRLKHDLLGCMGQTAQPHTFGRKLTKEANGGRNARNYLKDNCRLRLVITDNIQEARTLEQCFIYLLNPSYNSL